MKFKNTFFQVAKLRFSTISEKIPKFSNNYQRRSLKARGLIFWFLVIYICILAPVKTEFEKSLKWWTELSPGTLNPTPPMNLSGPRRPWKIELNPLMLFENMMKNTPTKPVQLTSPEQLIDTPPHPWKKIEPVITSYKPTTTTTPSNPPKWPL